MKIRIRRRWLVNYTFDGGVGRASLSTRAMLLNEALVVQMDQWLRDNYALPNAWVKDVRPINFPFGFYIEVQND